MFLRFTASALILFAVSPARSQEARGHALPPPDPRTNQAQTESAWLDLRQHAAANSKTQHAPSWVESVTMVPGPTDENGPVKTTFRIRVSRPRKEFEVLLFRLFFDDKADAQPAITAWDETGTQLLHAGVLGAGVDLSTSETVMVPMFGTSCIDVEVPGNGATVRGAYIDWMTSSEVVHPVSAEPRKVIEERFGVAGPLRAPAQDTEKFGTVTATLAAETIRIGRGMPEGAGFQFGIEAQPLVALLTFEVASPNIDAPPEVFVNGEGLGPVTLTLPDMADPAYRGEMAARARQMRFQYTGWLRAQKLVPAANLKVGTNDVIIIGGAGTPASAIRATQIQLKYLWDKSDYLLRP